MCGSRCGEAGTPFLAHAENYETREVLPDDFIRVGVRVADDEFRPPGAVVIRPVEAAPDSTSAAAGGRSRE